MPAAHPEVDRVAVQRSRSFLAPHGQNFGLACPARLPSVIRPFWESSPMLPATTLLPEAAPAPPSISFQRLVGEVTARAAIAIMLAGELSSKGERGAAAAGKLLELL